MINDVIETTFHVRYAETDQMGLVHHSAYVIWMEEGRSDFMRQKNIDYADVEKRGLALAVTELNVRYLASARYGEQVTVRTWVASLRSRMLVFGYEIVNAETKQKACENSTFWQDLPILLRKSQVMHDLLDHEIPQLRFCIGTLMKIKFLRFVLHALKYYYC